MTRAAAGHSAAAAEELHRRQEADSALEVLQSRLQEAGAELDGALKGKLQRAWMLGPRQVGPNLLLASRGAARDSGLFGVQKALVVPLARQQRPGRALNKARPFLLLCSVHLHTLTRYRTQANWSLSE